MHASLARLHTTIHPFNIYFDSHIVTPDKRLDSPPTLSLTQDDFDDRQKPNDRRHPYVIF